MRLNLAAAACAFVMIAAPTLSAADQPGWAYAYTNGVAAATQTDDHGKVTATIACAPPTGDIIVTDYTLLERSHGRVRATTAAIGIGNLTINVPATVARVGRQNVVTIHLPQRPPILAGVQQTDVVTVGFNNQTRTYLSGSAMQMKDIAYACWGS